MINVYERVAINKRNSFVVVACFFAFIMAAIYLIARAAGYGLDAVAIALIISGLSSLGGYYFSDSIVLSLSGAKPASKKAHFHFYTVAENLAMAAKLPMPKLFIIEDTAMNAFATGRDPQHAVVVATTGLLSRLNRTQLEGVIAHELSHVQNYDIRLMSIVSVLVGLVALLADWFLRFGMRGRNRDGNRESNQLQLLFMVAGIIMALLAPIVAQLIQLAISRKREFLADASGAKLTRYPEGLAQALEIISADKEPLEAANKATAHLYFSDPLRNRHDAVGWFASLFNTHPPVAERIKALRA